ncbi:MAG: DUF3168 domain-containing protein [Alphaproteobacteria bacterium]|nr:DUF3168 domain-containing protein [Alphaproteobacteria bacterium]
MSDLGWILQTAVHARLAADDGVKAILGDPPRIHDIAPEAPEFPFASYGEWRTAGLAGAPGHLEHDIRIRIFSRYAGRRETRDAMAALHDALQDAPLDLSGRRLVSMRFVFSDVFLRADGRTWNGVMRFRAVDAPAP